MSSRIRQFSALMLRLGGIGIILLGVVFPFVDNFRRSYFYVDPYKVLKSYIFQAVFPISIPSLIIGILLLHLGARLRKATLPGAGSPEIGESARKEVGPEEFKGDGGEQGRTCR